MAGGSDEVLVEEREGEEERRGERRGTRPNQTQAQHTRAHQEPDIAAIISNPLVRARAPQRQIAPAKPNKTTWASYTCKVHSPTHLQIRAQHDSGAHRGNTPNFPKKLTGGRRDKVILLVEKVLHRVLYSRRTEMD